MDHFRYEPSTTINDDDVQQQPVQVPEHHQSDEDGAQKQQFEIKASAQQWPTDDEQVVFLVENGNGRWEMEIQPPTVTAADYQYHQQQATTAVNVWPTSAAMFQQQDQPLYYYCLPWPYDQASYYQQPVPPPQQQQQPSKNPTMSDNGDAVAAASSLQPDVHQSLPPPPPSPQEPEVIGKESGQKSQSSLSTGAVHRLEHRANGSYTVSGEHIRRPPNAFMIFAKDRRREILFSNQRMTNKEVSKQLGKEWHNLPATHKTHFHKLSHQLRLEHQLKYPGYYYSPVEARRRKLEKRLKKLNKDSEEERRQRGAADRRD